MKIVVIGGVAAGLSAAAKARRLDKKARIMVFEQGPDISYGACGLPYYVSGLNPDPKKLFARTLEDFQKQNIDVLTHHRVLSINPAGKQVRVVNNMSGQQWDESYDKLMIATGAAAIRPKLPGVHLPGVFTLKTMADGRALRKAVEGAQRIAIAGGGYIGIEVAESLHSMGKQVCLAEAEAYPLGTFDPEIREVLLQRMMERGMNIQLNAPVLEIVAGEGGHACGMRTEQGTCPADLVVLASGVRPATGFLQNSGIQLADNGAIVVDRYQRTNLPDIYAAGDCALVWNRLEEAMVYSPLGTVANKCGRIAGENMVGSPVMFEGCLGSAAIAVYGMQAARTGLSEAAARAKYGDDVSVAFIKDKDRPDYYPGGKPLYIKTICQTSTGRLLGGQTAGLQGAALRCQTLAMGITMGATAHDLGAADFGYAPPFSKAWDALNIAGNALR